MCLRRPVFSSSIVTALLAVALYAAACLTLCIAGPHPPPFETIGGEWVGVFASGPVGEPNYLDPRIAFSSFDRRPRAPVSFADPKA